MRDMGFLQRGCEMNGFEAFSNITSNAIDNNRFVYIIGCLLYIVLCVSIAYIIRYSDALYIYSLALFTFPLRICILYFVHFDDLHGYPSAHVLKFCMLMHEHGH